MSCSSYVYAVRDEESVIEYVQCSWVFNAVEYVVRDETPVVVYMK